MTHLIDEAEFRARRGGITSADDRRDFLFRLLGHYFEQFLGAIGELVLFEHAHRSVPDDGLGLFDHFGELLDRLLADVQAEIVVFDATLLRCLLGVLGLDIVGYDEVHRQMDLHVLRLGFLENLLDRFRAFGVEERLADLHVVLLFEKGECHA